MRFLGRLITTIESRQCIDSGRAYLAGVSNGGGMAALAGCELADQVAAFASVAGGYDGQPPCRPRRPVSVFEVHGTADQIVPYFGRTRRPTRDGLPPFVNAWVARDRCRGAPSVSRLATRATEYRWMRCVSGVRVAHVRVLHGRHQWPGATPPDPGPPSTFCSACAIWRFFVEPRDGVTAVVNARRAMGLIGALILAAAVVAGCGAGKHRADTVRLPQLAAPTRSTAASLTRRPAVSVYYHVPPLRNPHNVYAADRTLAPVARRFRPLVYVPDTGSNDVYEIDPRTYRIVRHFDVGAVPQHIVPSYDLKTLWVNNDIGNSLTAINPVNGKPGRTIHVDDPYNLYFTPDGRYAMVMAEQLRRIDFRDAHTMRLHHELSCRCARASTTPTSPRTAGTCS